MLAMRGMSWQPSAVEDGPVEVPVMKIRGSDPAGDGRAQRYRRAVPRAIRRHGRLLKQEGEGVDKRRTRPPPECADKTLILLPKPLNRRDPDRHRSGHHSYAIFCRVINAVDRTATVVPVRSLFTLERFARLSAPFGVAMDVSRSRAEITLNG
jgi:hypothetical protein